MEFYHEFLVVNMRFKFGTRCTNTFNSLLKARVRQLRSELKNTKKASLSVSEYLLRIKSLGFPVSRRSLALLMVQEAQLEKFRQELSNPTVSANVAQSSVTSSGAPANHDQAAANNGYYNSGRGRFNGRGKGCFHGRGNSRSQCQICSKPIHEAYHCRYRFNQHAVNSTSGDGKKSSSSWFSLWNAAKANAFTTATISELGFTTIHTFNSRIHCTCWSA